MLSKNIKATELYCSLSKISYFVVLFGKIKQEKKRNKHECRK